MKQGWEIKPFEEILEKVKYSKKIPKQQYKKRGTYPIVSQEQEIISGFWDEKNDLFRLNKPIVIFGDHTKVVKYIDFDFVIGADGVKILSPTEEILTKYLYYFVLSVNLRDLGYARHFRLLKEQKIPVPSLLEQGRIVGVLDAAFAKIDALKGNAQKNLENAKALFQQVLKQELTPKPNWQTKKLGEIIKLQSGDSLSAKKMEEGPYPVYGGNGISGYHNQFNHNGEYIIVGRVGALCGNVRLVKGLFWVTDNAFILSQPKGEFYSLDFLAYYLNFQNLGSFARQTAQPVISNVALRDIQLYIPSRDEQKEIVRSLCCINQKCSKVIANAEKTIAECDALKQAVLRRAFNGVL